MTTFTLFKYSICNFSKLSLAKKMPFWKVVFYAFFLSFLLALPLNRQLFSVIQKVTYDGQQISKQLPDFELADGALLAPNSKGFIYQTNSIIFTFDPDGSRSVKDVISDSVGTAVSIGLLKDQLIISLPTNTTLDELLGTKHFTFPYTEGKLDGLSIQMIKQLVEKTAIPFWLKSILIFLTFYATFINFVINVLLIALGGSLYAKFRLFHWTFLDCLKLATYCSTLPVLFTSICQLINPALNGNLGLIFVSLFIFFFALKKENTEIT